MASEPINACFTDNNGYGFFDGRYWGNVGHGTDHKVTSVRDFVSQALGVWAATGGAKFRRLYINGHGAPGFQGLGSGVGGDDKGARSLQVGADSQLKGDAFHFLPALRGSFTEDGVVTLLGCEVAQGESGRALLRAAAKAMSVSVEARDTVQHHWLPFEEGHLVRASPGGQIFCFVH